VLLCPLASLDGQARFSILAIWAFAQVDVASVGTVDVATARTAELINGLAMIGSRQAGIADDHLTISVYIPDTTTVRLKVEQSQLVGIRGAFDCVIGLLKGL